MNTEKNCSKNWKNSKKPDTGQAEINPNFSQRNHLVGTRNNQVGNKMEQVKDKSNITNKTTDIM